MSDMIPYLPPGEIAPCVRALLAVFHEDTAHKLSIAPADSRPTVHWSDGTLCAVDEDGWPEAYDNLDKLDAIPVRPASVRDTETL
ncbi:hypothetical protein ACFQZZ_13285 [Nocardia sp. GCM10030253]|uniref:hypothetical protein n=1 Tax=Nocardia sp. GCM10030253 TaxID=3273404 RepID=UPI00362A6153